MTAADACIYGRSSTSAADGRAVQQFYDVFETKNYVDFFASVGARLAQTPLWHADFDKKDKLAVAELKRKLKSLPIRIDDIHLSNFVTDGESREGERGRTKSRRAG